MLFLLNAVFVKCGLKAFRVALRERRESNPQCVAYHTPSYSQHLPATGLSLYEWRACHYRYSPLWPVASALHGCAAGLYWLSTFHTRTLRMRPRCQCATLLVAGRGLEPRTPRRIGYRAVALPTELSGLLPGSGRLWPPHE